MVHDSLGVCVLDGPAVAGEVGSRGYMAPEQAARTWKPHETADVFALGSILCQFLTGHPAYRSAGPTEMSAEVAASRDELRRLGGEWAALAADCLADAPADRPQTAGAVADRIEQIRERERTRVRELERLREEQRERVRRLERRVVRLVLAGVLFVAGFSRVRNAQDADANGTQGAKLHRDLAHDAVRAAAGGWNPRPGARAKGIKEADKEFETADKDLRPSAPRGTRRGVSRTGSSGSSAGRATCARSRTKCGPGGSRSPRGAKSTRTASSSTPPSGWCSKPGRLGSGGSSRANRPVSSGDRRERYRFV